jgi:hypothetical protein
MVEQPRLTRLEIICNGVVVDLDGRMETLRQPGSLRAYMGAWVLRYLY